MQFNYRLFLVNNFLLGLRCFEDFFFRLLAIFVGLRNLVFSLVNQLRQSQFSHVLSQFVFYFHAA